ncbi:MAG: hypothetical protein ACKVP0_24355 [Pirellulaceae bacterium]
MADLSVILVGLVCCLLVPVAIVLIIMFSLRRIPKSNWSDP